MKRLLFYAVIALAVFSCTYGATENGSEADTLSTMNGSDAAGPGMNTTPGDTAATSFPGSGTHPVTGSGSNNTGQQPAQVPTGDTTAPRKPGQ